MGDIRFGWDPAGAGLNHREQGDVRRRTKRVLGRDELAATMALCPAGSRSASAPRLGPALTSGRPWGKQYAMAAVEVKPSVIEGLGVFAARPFAEGDRIRRVNVVREVTAEAPIREDLGERADHCNYPAGKVVLYGAPDRYLNHSCDPNAYEVHEENATYLVARKPIPAGTEITCDYNINIANGTAWPCRCGAPRCRGEVVGDFFRLPRQWQREYRSLLAGWFVDQHRERIDALDRER